MPRMLSHSYLEVCVAGAWFAVDAYIFDTPFLRGATARLRREGRATGYGLSRDTVNTWDGASDSLSQLRPTAFLEDHGRIENLDAYFRSDRYRNRCLGIPFNTLLRWLGDARVAPIYARLDGLRA